MKKPKILIIDDEKDFCHLMKYNLESTGKFKVLTATSGKTGLKKVHKKKPSVILLDIMMPDMDGLEVLSRLKQDQEVYEIPVIMLSALADKECREQACSWFAIDYLTKPVEFDSLISRVEKAIYFG